MREKEDAAQQYLEAREAVRNAKDPKAFLRLGMLYTQGIGIGKNYVLANYFFEKARTMGCKEAEHYMDIAYEAGVKDFAENITSAIGDPAHVSHDVVDRLWRRVERERKAGNYGNLSKIREYLPLFYPNYSGKKAIEDILNGRNTVDADILFSTCTSDNKSEVYLNSKDKLLSQLYAPVTTNTALYETIKKANCEQLLGADENELAQCLVNLTASYTKACRNHGIKPKELIAFNYSDFYPYIKPSTLTSIRRQGFAWLLSVKDLDPVIEERFLNNLDNDSELLSISEGVEDMDLQLFLISFVEFNIDINALELASLVLLRMYWNGNMVKLATHLNHFLQQLKDIGIQHDLPNYVPQNLPPIDLME